MSVILETSKLKKNFYAKHALRGIDLKLENGRILGLMGPNGSGKTTFLKIIAGLQKSSGAGWTLQGVG